MREDPPKRIGMILRKVFEILMAHPEGLPPKEVFKNLRESIELTEWEKGSYPTGVNRFETNVRFYTIACVKGGWMTKDARRWFVTEEGKKAYQQYTSPEEFYNAIMNSYREWHRRHRSEDDENESVEEQTETTEATLRVNFEQAAAQAWDEIEKYLRSMPPYDFQRLVAGLLKAMGYHISWVAPPGPDRGIDIIAWNDPLGTRLPRIKVQVKREQNPVNVGTLRSFMAVLRDSDVGIFVSTGGFTRDAEEEARPQQSRQITLLDLERFYDLWIEYLPKVDEEMRDLFPLKPIYFLAPEQI